jgi:hypothetical protein
LTANWQSYDDLEPRCGYGLFIGFPPIGMGTSHLLISGN